MDADGKVAQGGTSNILDHDSVHSAETEVGFDDYIDDFKYITTLYEDVLMAESESSLISEIKCGIDNGMIAMLMFLQKRCRDPKIRRRTIAMLPTSIGQKAV